MGKCNKCGKKGLFLKINQYGRCPECERQFQENKRIETEKMAFEKAQEAKRKEEEKRNNACKLFDEIDERLNAIRIPVMLRRSLGASAIEKEKNIDLIQAEIDKCNELISILNEAQNNQYLFDIIKSHITPDKYLDSHGKIEKWGVFIHKNIDTRKYEYNDILDSAKRSVTNRIRDLKTFESSVHNNASFERSVLNIESFGAQPMTMETQPINFDINKIKLSTITAKDFYASLGNFVSLATANNTFYAIKYVGWNPKSKMTCELSPDYAPPIDDYIGSFSIVCADLYDTVFSLVSAGCSFVKQKRRYYDVVSLAKQAIQSPKWNKETPYSYSPSGLCDYFKICDTDAFESNPFVKCCALAVIFNKVCSFRAT